MTIISNFVMFKILIDGRNSCDIMYSNCFEKMGLKKKKVRTYERFGLQDFNDDVTCLWGYIELMVTMGEGKYSMIINS